MPEPRDRVSFRLRPRLSDTAGEGPLVVTIQIGLDYTLDFLPALNHPRSTISRAIQMELRMLGIIDLTATPPFRLRDLRIESQRVPDIDVTVSAAPSLLKVHGMLGADFFRNYSQVIWDPATNVVTLIP